MGLPDAEAIARRGQDTLEAGQRLALDAVDDAKRDEFSVGEDYSVTDTREVTTREQLAERQAEAQAHSNFIRHRVAHLVANDQYITDQLKTATAGWGTLTFAESPGGADDTIVGDDRDKHIRPVDRTWKRDPAPTPDPGRTADDLREAIKDLPQGSRPNYLEVRTPEDLRKLWDWSSANAPTYTPTKPYRGGDGIMRQLPDGTIVGLGPSDEYGPTMDVQFPNGDYTSRAVLICLILAFRAPVFVAYRRTNTTSAASRCVEHSPDGILTGTPDLAGRKRSSGWLNQILLDGLVDSVNLAGVQRRNRSLQLHRRSAATFGAVVLGARGWLAKRDRPVEIPKP